MRIECPNSGHIARLRQLWQIAFGDTDAFLDLFYNTAFSPDRCRCVLTGERIAAVLYWFDCDLENNKLAYIYAVATHPDFRGQGLCRMLMADTHALLKERGYAGAVLVPQKESLRKMYAGMGYRDAGGLNRFSCEASDIGITLRTVDAPEFMALRRTFLPNGSIIQERENTGFLAAQMQFYAGSDFLLTAFAEEEVLQGVELLGNTAAAPGILKTLGFSRGCFRTPGNQHPFAMFHPLNSSCPIPEYFGFAFD